MIDGHKTVPHRLRDFGTYGHVDAARYGRRPRQLSSPDVFRGKRNLRVHRLAQERGGRPNESRKLVT